MNGTKNRMPNNKRLQLTPNSSLQLIRGTVLAAGPVRQRWRSALLGAAEPLARYTALAPRRRDTWQASKPNASSIFRRRTCGI